MIGSSTGATGSFTGSVIRAGGMICFITSTDASPENPVATTTSSMALPSWGFSLVPQMILALCITPLSSCTLAWAWIYSRMRTTSSYISESAFDTEMFSRIFFAPEIRL